MERKKVMRKMKKLAGLMILTALFVALLLPTDAQAASASKSALKAYNRLLQKKSYTIEREKYNMTNGVFSVAYIDNDSIPELLVRIDWRSGNNMLSRLALFTYKNGKVKLLDTRPLGLLGGYGNKYGYYKKKGVFFTDFAHGDYGGRSYYKISKGKAALKLSKGIEMQASGKSKITYENAAQKKLTKAKFNQTLKKMVGSKKATWMKMYPNTAASRARQLK